MENAYALPIDKVLASFQVDVHEGLTDEQTNELRKKHGRNGRFNPRKLHSLPLDHNLHPTVDGTLR